MEKILLVITDKMYKKLLEINGYLQEKMAMIPCENIKDGIEIMNNGSMSGKVETQIKYIEFDDIKSLYYWINNVGTGIYPHKREIKEVGITYFITAQ